MDIMAVLVIATEPKLTKTYLTLPAYLILAPDPEPNFSLLKVCF